MSDKNSPQINWVRREILTLYWGQTIQFIPLNPAKESEIAYGKVVSFTEEGVAEIHESDGRHANYALIDSCRPILRRVSELTIEEVKDYLSSLVHNIDTASVEHIHQDVLRNFDIEKPQDIGLVNFLRRQGIDCDGLIDSGLAIDKSTIKVEEPSMEEVV